VCVCVCLGTSCGTGEDGHISADVWNQSGARQTLPGESECRPVTKWTPRLLSQGATGVFLSVSSPSSLSLQVTLLYIACNNWLYSCRHSQHTYSY